MRCDPRDRGVGDLLHSPRLVVEVLSPSTELKDRTWKLQNYTAHPTIEEYMLVSARSLKIDLYRKEQNKWVYYAFGPNEDIDLACLGVHFPVADVYEGINPDEDFSTREENGDHKNNSIQRQYDMVYYKQDILKPELNCWRRP